MNTPRIFLTGLIGLVLVASPGGLMAQMTVEGTAEDAASAPVALRTPEQLDELLGPIALFPDPLIAVILPAAANSSDIVLASRFLAAGGDPEQTADQPWAESVRALAHYQDIIDWLDQHLEWTIEVGEAFVAQPVDVMDSIQRLRALARSAGNLKDTPEQRIVEENGKIYIVAAQPDVIYVPVYDPSVVYVRRPGYWTEPCVTFGWGFSIGSWLSYDCDWYHYRIWIGDCYRPWPEYRYWRHPSYVIRPGYHHDRDWRTWHPPVRRVHHPRTHDNDGRPPHSIRPTPFPRRDRDGPGVIRDRNRSVVRVQGGLETPPSGRSAHTNPGAPSVVERDRRGSSGPSGGSAASRPNRDGNRGGRPGTPPSRGGSDGRGRTDSTSDSAGSAPRAATPTVRTAPQPQFGAAPTPAAPAPSVSAPSGRQNRPNTPSAGGSRGSAGAPSRPSSGGAVSRPAPAPRTQAPAPSVTRPSSPAPASRPSSSNSSSRPSSAPSVSRPAPSSSPPPSASRPSSPPPSQPRSNSGGSSSSSSSSQPRGGSRPSNIQDN